MESEAEVFNGQSMSLADLNYIMISFTSTCRYMPLRMSGWEIQ